MTAIALGFGLTIAFVVLGMVAIVSIIAEALRGRRGR